MSYDRRNTKVIPNIMRAIRLHAPGPQGLVEERVDAPHADAGEALVRVHAAAITRDELEWPVDRLPAIPSYEMSGVVAAVGSDVHTVTVGESVCALTPFDRDGAAADYVAVPGRLLAPKPANLDHVESSAVPLAALSAWQGLLERALAVVRTSGRAVSVAEEPPSIAAETASTLATSSSSRAVSSSSSLRASSRPALCGRRSTVFPFADARAAFERSLSPGKRGKVVLRVADD